MDSKADQVVPSRSVARRLAVQSAPAEALYTAVDRSVAVRLEKGSFKLEGPLKARCMQICEAEGTEFSEFLRECCENLRTAYDGPEGGENYTPLPRNAANRVDKPLIRRMYLASKFVEWVPFCQENNWNPKLARTWCPTATWIQEKRELVEQTMAAELRQLQLDHRQSWIKDVRSTLEEYPKAVDNVMFLVQKFMQTELRRVNVAGAVPSDPYRLSAIAETVKKCIDAKKSILLISEAVVALRPPDPEAPKDGDEAQWTMEIRGMKSPTVKEVQELFDRYVDKPMAKPLEPPPAEDAELLEEPSDAEA